MEEAKNQFLYLLPVIITNVSYYLIPVVAVMFAGHLGDLELAGSILTLSWATVTGFAFMVLLSLSPCIILLDSVTLGHWGAVGVYFG